MSQQNLITVVEFKALAPDMDLTRFPDPVVSGMIQSASEEVANYLEYNPLAEDVVDELANGMITSEFDLLIFVKRPPIQTLSAVAVVRGAESIDFTLTNSGNVPRYNIDYTRRNIRLPYEQLTVQGGPILVSYTQLRGSQFYTKISYRGGFEASELPQAIKMATMFLVRDFLSDQFNTTGATKIRQGGLTLEYGQSSMDISANIKSAKRLLGPYKKV